jgi:YVTN family beta-propeller protein
MRARARVMTTIFLAMSGAFLLPGCEDDPVRGLPHGELDIIPFESALSDLEADVSRNVIYIADERVNRVHVLDVSTDEVVGSIAVGSKPTKMVMDPGGNSLFVALRGEYAVAVIDLDQRQVVRRLDIPFSAAWLDVTGDGRLFVGPNDADDGETLAIDAVTGAVLHDLRVSGGWSPVGEFVTVSDSLFLLVRSRDLFKWNISDPNTSDYRGVVELDEIHTKYEFATSNDGSIVYISGTLGRANQVEAYRTADLAKVGEFDTQQGVEFACLSPDGSRAYVATSMQATARGSSAATYILEYDTVTYARTSQYLALGNMAGASLAVSQDGAKLYAVIDNPYRVSDNPTQELRQDLQVIVVR